MRLPLALARDPEGYGTAPGTANGFAILSYERVPYFFDSWWQQRAIRLYFKNKLASASGGAKVTTAR